jgi:K+-sensing histidine kinase KdpD
MSRTVLRYGLVLVLIATALAISLVLQPFIPHGFVYLFLAAVVVGAWRGNRGPGLFAVVLASLTLDYFFLPPLHTLGIGRGAWSYFFPFLLSALAVEKGFVDCNSAALQMFGYATPAELQASRGLSVGKTRTTSVLGLLGSSFARTVYQLGYCTKLYSLRK